MEANAQKGAEWVFVMGIVDTGLMTLGGASIGVGMITPPGLEKQSSIFLTLGALSVAGGMAIKSSEGGGKAMTKK